MSHEGGMTMVIMTAKLTKKKRLGLLLAAAAVVLVAVLALRGGGDPTRGVRTDADRVEYLAACGYTVSPEPVQVQEVTVPTEDTELFARYNMLQTQQGFDLEPYRGKCVKRYVYAGTGEDGRQVTVCILQSGSRIIGGDVSCQEETDPWMQGLPRPDGEKM